MPMAVAVRVGGDGGKIHRLPLLLFASICQNGDVIWELCLLYSIG